MRIALDISRDRVFSFELKIHISHWASSPEAKAEEEEPPLLQVGKSGIGGSRETLEATSHIQV